MVNGLIVKWNVTWGGGGGGSCVIKVLVMLTLQETDGSYCFSYLNTTRPPVRLCSNFFGIILFFLFQNNVLILFQKIIVYYSINFIIILLIRNK